MYDTKDTRPFGKDSASRYVFCNMSEDDAGKELRIELTSHASNYSGVVIQYTVEIRAIYGQISFITAPERRL